MKLWVCVVAVVSLALTGCGNTACESMANALESLDKKIEPCGLSNDEPFTDADIDQCDKEVDASCSSSDKSALHEFADCISDVPVCSKSNTDPFTTGIDACDAKLTSKLSPACNGAVNGESLTRKAALLRQSH